MKTVRCAVYTRKSSEEGLELQFNSLHAQRESCEAYVLSQAGEGWTCLKDEYDDGGISGGHMNRPGLKKLIADIKQSKVDVIVVYKVDRLTRSLTDFSKLVEVFDEHDVSFVSVTQAFNTTNSMGRLTLNVLLSFAQFEREVTGERIRDKIALSRKHGLWTGGLAPLGYDAIDKKLIINESEAVTVRHIYNRYADLKNVRRLKADLDRGGYVSKFRTRKTGKQTGGKPFERGALYTILKNQTYLGLTTHKGEVFDGEHEAILDKVLFDKVQTILTANRQRDKHKAGAKDPSLLSGKIITDTGIILTPTHAQTHGRRYRYYVERRNSGQVAILQTRPVSLPAAEIEQSVCNELANYFLDPVKLIDDLDITNCPQELQISVREKTAKISALLNAPTKKVKDNIVIRKLVKRVELLPIMKGYKLSINLLALAKTLGLPNPPSIETATLTNGLDLKICNNGKKVIIGNKPAMMPVPNPSLINALKIGHRIKQQYMGADKKQLSEIAKDMNIDKRHACRTLKMAYLAPDIQLSILSGTQPRGLLLKDLLYQFIPTSWEEQRLTFGFTA